MSFTKPLALIPAVITRLELRATVDTPTSLRVPALLADPLRTSAVPLDSYVITSMSAEALRTPATTQFGAKFAMET